ncbi:alpha-L-fucosidase [Bombus terrestris]|uniref:Putative alpha-L-fucosidase n=1 Tax=Bombus terrestris TaxID=30195 RepID=A0A9C6SCE0_BOMTE|nr:alpha-L-fucosidase [Bombus terrestris]XP_048263358.1 alpha-L-fucosidase [Bombus terrestris]XP_048263359.1 alpha-L-fucosidase [Bombus terrestris]XP_048263360.1 alpha-L-fucosidase [Bombus terrestris]
MILQIYILFISSMIYTTLGKDQYVLVTSDIESHEILWPIKTEINHYSPTWDSLDSRPLPTWYDDAKIGIFIHWGVFSVPSFGSEWFWNNWKEEKIDTKYSDFMKQRYPPSFTYQDFAHEFTAEFFNATQWSELFQASGAKYVVLTSKHHEGYTLWPSKYSFSWNSADVGPKKDLIGELATAIRNSTNLKFGLYHSLYEWYNPLYLFDKDNNFTTQIFVRQKIIPELHEVVEKYKPEIVWSDGDWEAPDVYWKSKEFLAWLYNESPVKDTVVVNDRWGQNIPCHHGDFYTCSDRYNPGVLLPHKWENCMTIDRKSWGFRRNAVLSEYLTLSELVKELAITVSCGGNLLMNIGPTKDGIISPIFEERLRGMGEWLKINGEAIYNTKPWMTQNDTLSNTVWYTQSKNTKQVYAIILEWPNEGLLYLGSLKTSPSTQISVLGSKLLIRWKQINEKLIVSLPAELDKGQPAWVLKIKPK